MPTDTPVVRLFDAERPEPAPGGDAELHLSRAICALPEESEADILPFAKRGAG